MENRIHQFNPVIYPLKLWVSNGNNEAALSEVFEEIDGGSLSLGENGISAASTYDKVVVHKETELYGVLVMVDSEITVNQIAHEATHAARFWWDWLEEDQTGREADAYLVGWIAECIDIVKGWNYELK